MNTNNLELLEICNSVMGGANYTVGRISGVDYDFQMWLCDVTKFLYGDFPAALWLKDCTL